MSAADNKNSSYITDKEVSFKFDGKNILVMKEIRLLQLYWETMSG